MKNLAIFQATREQVNMFKAMTSEPSACMLSHLRYRQAVRDLPARCVPMMRGQVPTVSSLLDIVKSELEVTNCHELKAFINKYNN